MVRRRPSSRTWSPTALPSLAKANARTEQLALTRWQRVLADPSSNPQRLERAAMWVPMFTDSLASWRATEFFWVTEAMTRVALDASTDMPAFIPAAEMPTDHGLLGFQTPLPELRPPTPLRARDGATVDRALPVDLLRWQVVPGGSLLVTVLCRIEHIGEHPVDPDAPMQELFMFAIEDSTAPITLDMDAVPEDRRAQLAVLALLGSTWHLMQQPTVATPTPRDSITGTPRAPRSPGESPARLVTTIDLRTLRHVPTEDQPTEGTGRVYRHRWVVRGHWRHQPHGKARAQRRLQWVPSYVKGPAGAPLIESEKVMVWRR